MEYYVGLDVSLKQTSICVVDQAGLVVREGVVDSDPEAIRPAQKETPCSKGPGRLKSPLILISGRTRPDCSHRSKRGLMPRYFFHIYHDRAELDREGEELPDKHAAWREATITAGQTLQGIDGKLKPGHGWRMEVTDEFQNTLYVLHNPSLNRNPPVAFALFALLKIFTPGRVG
jgi:hypothetical protein